MTQAPLDLPVQLVPPVSPERTAKTEDLEPTVPQEPTVRLDPKEYPALPVAPALPELKDDLFVESPVNPEHQATMEKTVSLVYQESPVPEDHQAVVTTVQSSAQMCAQLDPSVPPDHPDLKAIKDPVVSKVLMVLLVPKECKASKDPLDQREKQVTTAHRESQVKLATPARTGNKVNKDQRVSPVSPVPLVTQVQLDAVGLKETAEQKVPLEYPAHLENLEPLENQVSLENLVSTVWTALLVSSESREPMVKPVPLVYPVHLVTKA